jgi:hypothetical protein
MATRTAWSADTNRARTVAAATWTSAAATDHHDHAVHAVPAWL